MNAYPTSRSEKERSTFPAPRRDSERQRRKAVGGMRYLGHLRWWGAPGRRTSNGELTSTFYLESLQRWKGPKKLRSCLDGQTIRRRQVHGTGAMTPIRLVLILGAGL